MVSGLASTCGQGKPRKDPQVVLLALLGSLLVCALLCGYWTRHANLESVFSPTAPFAITAVIWCLALGCGVYHATFKIAAVLTGRARVRRPAAGGCSDDGLCSGRRDFRCVVLYATCDDFQPHACLSCVEQDIAAPSYRVLICDDSTQLRYRAEIDRFRREHPRVSVIRRRDRQGFKAANVNHAIESATTGEDRWLVLVDADHILPRDYLAKVAAAVDRFDGDRVAFVQGRNASDCAIENAERSNGCNGSATSFQRVLGVDLDIHYRTHIACRQRWGFLPMLGHGVAVRRQAWHELGGFPELVFEDFAFSLHTSETDWHGIYDESLHSWEAFPKDFAALFVRVRRLAGGAAEFFRRLGRRLVLGQMSWTEKVDLALILAWYPLTPLLVVNTFLSAYVGHLFWRADVSPVGPLLAAGWAAAHVILVAIDVLTVEVKGSVMQRCLRVAGHWFWSFSIYSSCLPVVAWRFCKHLWLPPRFDRTPKCERGSRAYARYSLPMVALGVAVISAAAIWPSPLSPLVASQGAAYVLFPAHAALNRVSLMGRLARTAVFLPGALWLAGACTMLCWALS